MGVKAVTDEHEIMMINTAGIIIQLRASDFNPIGRITSGVKMMNLDEGVKVVQIAKVRGSVTDDEPKEDGITEDDLADNDLADNDFTEDEVTDSGFADDGSEEEEENGPDSVS